MALFDSPRIGASGATSYQIQRSLRSNRSESAYHYHDMTTAETSRYKMTFSAWVKRTSLDSSNTHSIIGSEDNWELPLSFYQDHFRATGPGSSAIYISTQLFRDMSAWYHLMTVYDTQNSTAADRMICYINGQRLTDFDTFTTSSQNQTTSRILRNGYETRIGRTGGGAYGDMYIAEVNAIDGQALTPSDFTETDPLTGQLIPKKYTGTYGNNGFYLNYSDNSSTSALGTDYSGNSKTFTMSNYSVSAGTGNDSVIDTPTNNFPTWQPLYVYSQTGGTTAYSEGNLKLNTTSGSSTGNLYPFGFTTFGVRSGKWYAEFRCASNSVAVGVANSGQLDSDVSSNPYGAHASTSIIYTSRGEVRTNNSNVSGSYPLYYNNDVIGVALDLDNNKIYFHKSGTYINSGNPSTGSNGFTLGTMPSNRSGDFIFSCGSDGVSSVAVFANLGQHKTASTSYSDANGIGSFDYEVPTGYKAVCTSNIPDPLITFPDKHFDTRTYTGTGASNTQTLTGFNFSPDWVWGKSRSTAYNHGTFDTIRGATNRLWPNITNAEASNNAITAFTSDGYTVGTDAFNENNQVTWNWEAADSNTTNNDGSVTSTIRANTTAGFSICSWTGTGSNLTVGHGLGVVPDLYIVKARSGSSGCDWFVYHHFIGATKNLRLNRNYAATSASDLFNNTEPTSSVFSIGNSSCINENGGTYITYVFSEVAGYSKFGSYEANNSSDGPFVDLGFEPQWVMMKPIDDSGDWQIYDNQRTPLNKDDGNALYSNLNSAETSGFTMFDFLSNGFKLKNTGGGGINYTNTYIYLAFAEAPFKYTRAR